MSNRKAHRREHSYRRHEKSIAVRLRRPNRSDRAWRQFETRSLRRGVWELIRRWLAETVEAPA